MKINSTFAYKPILQGNTQHIGLKNSIVQKNKTITFQANNEENVLYYDNKKCKTDVFGIRAKLQKKQEDEAKKEQGGGILSILPFGNKKNEIQTENTESFESIPVQINDNILNKIKNKDEVKEPVEAMVE